MKVLCRALLATLGMGCEPDLDPEVEPEVDMFHIAADGPGIIWHQADASSLGDGPVMRRGEVGLHPHYALGNLRAEDLVQLVAAQLVGLLLDHTVIDHVGHAFGRPNCSR
jgi:hypothetical protein